MNILELTDDQRELGRRIGAKTDEEILHLFTSPATAADFRLVAPFTPEVEARLGKPATPMPDRSWMTPPSSDVQMLKPSKLFL
jgi:hypothetical protein